MCVTTHVLHRLCPHPHHSHLTPCPEHHLENYNVSTCGGTPTATSVPWDHPTASTRITAPTTRRTVARNARGKPYKGSNTTLGSSAGYLNPPPPDPRPRCVNCHLDRWAEIRSDYAKKENELQAEREVWLMGALSRELNGECGMDEKGVELVKKAEMLKEEREEEMRVWRMERGSLGQGILRDLFAVYGDRLFR